MNLNQVTLPALDLAPAVAFYQRLGLRLIVEDLPHYARFECPDGESTLSLEQVAERGAGPSPVVYFECEDLDEIVRRLSSAGVQFDSRARRSAMALARGPAPGSWRQLSVPVLGGPEPSLSALAHRMSGGCHQTLEAQ